VKTNVGKAIAGGFVGTILLTLMTRFVAPMMTGQKMDIAARLGDMTGTGPIAGMIMHFFVGSVVFALIYVFVLFRFLPGAPWIKGLICGLIFWLGLEIAMMPMIGGGFFSSHIGGMKVVVAALIAHLVYGAALGGIAGAPVAKQS
jgi:uncharacterized membrane protein YagU involved in acid resistance